MSLRDYNWTVMIKFKESSNRGAVGMPKGSIWRRKGEEPAGSDWRPARALELDIYYNGVTRIEDLSRL